MKFLKNIFEKKLLKNSQINEIEFSLHFDDGNKNDEDQNDQNIEILEPNTSEPSAPSGLMKSQIIELMKNDSVLSFKNHKNHKNQMILTNQIVSIKKKSNYIEFSNTAKHASH